MFNKKKRSYYSLLLDFPTIKSNLHKTKQNIKFSNIVCLKSIKIDIVYTKTSKCLFI